MVFCTSEEPEPEAPSSCQTLSCHRTQDSCANPRSSDYPGFV
uniref:Uncharacterized protein n=1 Tax=Arundo donax TaxID=35708 RepID=A0A0A9ESD3_ARUDO